MCGRVVQKTPLSEIRVLFETVNPIPNSPSNFNAAPTQVLPVVRLGAERHSAEGKLDQEGRRSLDLLQWGLIPFWAKDATISALHQRDGRDRRHQTGIPRGFLSRSALSDTGGWLLQVAKDADRKQAHLLGIADRASQEDAEPRFEWRLQPPSRRCPLLRLTHPLSRHLEGYRASEVKAKCR